MDQTAFKKLSVLIIWPSRQQAKKTWPRCFEKLYPKTKTIIDCTEVFTELPVLWILTAFFGETISTIQPSIFLYA